jgi:hypothetical protein
MSKLEEVKELTEKGKTETYSCRRKKVPLSRRKCGNTDT